MKDSKSEWSDDSCRSGCCLRGRFYLHSFFVEMEERRQSKIMRLCGIWRQHFKLVSFFQVGTSDIYIGIKCKLQCGEKILYASIWSVGKEVLSIWDSVWKFSLFGKMQGKILLGLHWEIIWDLARTQMCDVDWYHPIPLQLIFSKIHTSSRQEEELNALLNIEFRRWTNVMIRIYELEDEDFSNVDVPVKPSEMPPLRRGVLVNVSWYMFQ